MSYDEPSIRNFLEHDKVDADRFLSCVGGFVSSNRIPGAAGTIAEGLAGNRKVYSVQLDIL